MTRKSGYSKAVFISEEGYWRVKIFDINESMVSVGDRFHVKVTKKNGEKVTREVRIRRIEDDPYDLGDSWEGKKIAICSIISRREIPSWGDNDFEDQKGWDSDPLDPFDFGYDCGDSPF